MKSNDGGFMNVHVDRFGAIDLETTSRRRKTSSSSNRQDKTVATRNTKRDTGSSEDTLHKSNSSVIHKVEMYEKYENEGYSSSVLEEQVLKDRAMDSTKFGVSSALSEWRLFGSKPSKTNSLKVSKTRSSRRSELLIRDEFNEISKLIEEGDVVESESKKPEDQLLNFDVDSRLDNLLQEIAIVSIREEELKRLDLLLNSFKKLKLYFDLKQRRKLGEHYYETRRMRKSFLTLQKNRMMAKRKREMKRHKLYIFFQRWKQDFYLKMNFQKYMQHNLYRIKWKSFKRIKYYSRIKKYKTECLNKGILFWSLKQMGICFKQLRLHSKRNRYIRSQNLNAQNMFTSNLKVVSFRLWKTKSLQYKYKRMKYETADLHFFRKQGIKYLRWLGEFSKKRIKDWEFNVAAENQIKKMCFLRFKTAIAISKRERYVRFVLNRRKKLIGLQRLKMHNIQMKELKLEKANRFNEERVLRQCLIKWGKRVGESINSFENKAKRIEHIKLHCTFNKWKQYIQTCIKVNCFISKRKEILKYNYFRSFVSIMSQEFSVNDCLDRYRKQKERERMKNAIAILKLNRYIGKTYCIIKSKMEKKLLGRHFSYWVLYLCNRVTKKQKLSQSDSFHQAYLQSKGLNRLKLFVHERKIAQRARYFYRIRTLQRLFSSWRWLIHENYLGEFGNQHWERKKKKEALFGLVAFASTRFSYNELYKNATKYHSKFVTKRALKILRENVALESVYKKREIKTIKVLFQKFYRQIKIHKEHRTKRNENKQIALVHYEKRSKTKAFLTLWNNQKDKKNYEISRLHFRQHCLILAMKKLYMHAKLRMHFGRLLGTFLDIKQERLIQQMFMKWNGYYRLQREKRQGLSKKRNHMILYTKKRAFHVLKMKTLVKNEKLFKASETYEYRLLKRTFQAFRHDGILLLKHTYRHDYWRKRFYVSIWKEFVSKRKVLREKIHGNVLVNLQFINQRWFFNIWKRFTVTTSLLESASCLHNHQMLSECFQNWVETVLQTKLDRVNSFHALIHWRNGMQKRYFLQFKDCIKLQHLEQVADGFYLFKLKETLFDRWKSYYLKKKLFRANDLLALLHWRKSTLVGCLNTWIEYKLERELYKTHEVLALLHWRKYQLNKSLQQWKLLLPFTNIYIH